MAIETIEDAQHELQVMIDEAVEDLGLESGDEIAKDMLVSCCFNIADDDLARELCRIEVGSVPYELEDRLGRKDWIQ